MVRILSPKIPIHFPFNASISASKIFSSMAVFSIMREAIQNVFGGTSTMIRGTQINQIPLLWDFSILILGNMLGKVSLDRLEDFLQNTELLDSFQQGPRPNEEPSTSFIVAVDENNSKIGFKNASFVWSKSNEEEGSVTSSKRSFKLRVDGEVFFKRDCINLIIGPTWVSPTLHRRTLPNHICHLLT